MIPPTILTDRLVLRAIKIDDFDAYVEIWQNETVVEYIGAGPLSREACWARMLRAMGHWQLLGFGFWGIFEPETERLIGEAGFLSLKRDIQPTLEGTLETGWCLLPEYHGNGYAIEAVTAAMNWAERALPPKDFTCIISPENKPSIRLAEKAGFEKVTDTSYHGPITIYRKRSKSQRS